MTCTRCKGLMVTARFSDYYHLCYEWRCLNCGAIVFPPSIDQPAALEVKQRLSLCFDRRYAYNRSK